MTGVAIAAPHSDAVTAAEAVVSKGGGAVDAAIAAAAALTVAYPHQCSIGGDLIALFRSPDGEVRAVLSAGAAAAGFDVTAVAGLDRMPPGGPLAITVPGVVAGWARLAELGARLPLGDLLQPAIGLARDGVAVSPGLARGTHDRLAVVRQDPGLSALVLDEAGEPLPVGATLRQPVLAATLTEVAGDWKSFYTGPLSQRVAAALEKFGSPLRASDLAAHEPEVCEPLSTTKDGVVWSVAPPPSQGAALLAVLAAAPAERLAAAREAELRRDALLGDPAMGPIDVAGLLGAASRSVEALPTGPKPAGDTVAVTAVAEDGSAVTLIQSVFQTFGSGLLDPGTGIVFHNRGSAFSIDPDHPGRVRPGARPPHTLCPVIAVSDESVLALGCQGGRAQAWILSQVAEDAMVAPNLRAVLDRPRWVIGSRDIDMPRPTLLLEPGVPTAEALEAAADSLGLDVVTSETKRDDAGHVQACRLDRRPRPDTLLDAAPDGALNAALDGALDAVPRPGGQTGPDSHAEPGSQTQPGREAEPAQPSQSKAGKLLAAADPRADGLGAVFTAN
ncbi:gamma-glutamyltransferase [Kineosporia rhizophila]|uniref:gamma-glutamyltransferase n=1 Tax=Kineosporia rhizophila TaxID=84633 RepID=UPI001E344F00|nr:gamma-glutamyltransferase [Kineosporia rhizophila]MCE0539464.1 gamma-glutamyltransferase [Kineosporia rhizophila]